MPSTHISIRVTDQRRANLDALAAIIRSDSDVATIDFALGYALAQLDREEEPPMMKQHGVVFEAPRCPQCGAELSLNRFAWGIGWGQTKVQYVWYCPRPDCANAVERPATPDEVPQTVLDAYGDPALEYVTSDNVVRRLRQLADVDELLGH